MLQALLQPEIWRLTRNFWLREKRQNQWGKWLNVCYMVETASVRPLREDGKRGHNCWAFRDILWEARIDTKGQNVTGNVGNDGKLLQFWAMPCWSLQIQTIKGGLINRKGSWDTGTNFPFSFNGTWDLYFLLSSCSSFYPIFTHSLLWPFIRLKNTSSSECKLHLHNT